MTGIIGCEESQEVAKAFRALGHEVYSCDILPCSGGHPEWHIQDDIRNHLNDGWDFGIFHVPCTRLTNSVIWYIKKYNLWHEVDAACELFNECWHSPIPKKAMENPIMHGYAKEKIGSYTQIIQPYNFGEDASKSTCLWLNGFPPLTNTSYYPPPICERKKTVEQSNRWRPKQITSGFKA